MKKNLRITILSLLLVSLMIFSMVPIHALTYETREISDGKIITSAYYSVTADDNYSIDVLYDPDWFKTSSRVYNHDLAKLSMGLALASFRPDKDHLDGITSPDMNLSNFLTAADFKDLRSDDYDKNPYMYSISTMMGHQKIEDPENGDFELIAVGVCGQKYADEWESNFSIGTGKVHDGFQRSANLVYDRIFGYIANLHLEGPYKIWLSGFSRAAAVSSLTASMLTDSKYFDQDSVYAYTFATPRYVKDKDYARYENIYNIVGKTDPVPCVPFAEWGYERYGQTFYLPTFETDSDFEERRVKANQIYKDLTGLDFWYNKETNYFLKTILGYLLEICPTPEKYYQCLQDKIIHIWADSSPVNILSTLLSIANDPELINEETRSEANQLLNHLVTLLRDYREETALFKDWNNKASVGINLAQAHTPEIYMSWLFSTDEIQKIYNQYDTYSEFYISGDAEVSIVKDGKVLETLPTITKYNQRTGEYVNVKKSDRVSTAGYNFLSYTDYTVMALVPRDKEYSIVLKTDNGTDVRVVQLDYAIDAQMPKKINSYFYYMPPGTDMIITTTGLEYEFGPDDVVDMNYTPVLETTITSTAGINKSKFEHYDPGLDYDLSDAILVTRPREISLYWNDAVMIAISVGLFVISIIFFQITYLFGRVRFKRRKKRGMLPSDAKYRGLPTLMVYSIFLLFMIMEFYARLLPNNRHIIIIFKAVIGFISVGISFFGYRKNQNVLSRRIMTGLILLMIADLFMSVSVNVGPVFHILAYGYLSFAYIADDKPDKIQYIIWIVLSALSIEIINEIKGDYGNLKFFAMIYVSAALLMAITSVDQNRTVLVGSVLLFVAGVLTIYNFIIGNTFFSHIISLGTYYAGVGILASSTIQKQMYRYIPVPIQNIEEGAK